MPNSKDVFKWVVKQITLDESQDEIMSIAYLLLENKLGLTRSEIIGSRILEITYDGLLPFIQRINQGEPIQYIVGSQEFYGRSFLVNPSVLIPRPETERIIDVALEYANRQGEETINILDIGTGTGCIPITMQLENKRITGVGIDFSEEAIKVAKANNRNHQTKIDFRIVDVLKEDLPRGNYDIVLSNPPYITEKEKEKMKANVVGYEPHSALFVPNENPLLFYEAIAAKSKNRLIEGGLLALEINEMYGLEVVNRLRHHGYHSILIHKDYDNKDRIVSAELK